MPKVNSVRQCSFHTCRKRTDQRRFGVVRPLTSSIVQRHSRRLKQHGVESRALCDQHWKALHRLEASLPPRPRVLVLGMAFVTEVFARLAAQHARQSTSNPYHRDRARLLALSERYDVLTMNADAEERHCEPGQHCQAYWSRRGALSMVQRFPSFARLDMVLLDYFRFPGEYMRTAYGCVFRDVLPTLRAEGMVTDATIIVVPHLDPIFLRPLGTSRRVEPISAQNNPLFVATEQVEQKDLGDFTNDSQVLQLHSLLPFVRVLLA